MPPYSFGLQPPIDIMCFPQCLKLIHQLRPNLPQELIIVTLVVSLPSHLFFSGLGVLGFLGPQLITLPKYKQEDKR